MENIIESNAMLIEGDEASDITEGHPGPRVAST